MMDRITKLSIVFAAFMSLVAIVEKFDILTDEQIPLELKELLEITKSMFETVMRIRDELVSIVSDFEKLLKKVPAVTESFLNGRKEETENKRNGKHLRWTNDTEQQMREQAIEQCIHSLADQFRNATLHLLSEIRSLNATMQKSNQDLDECVDNDVLYDCVKPAFTESVQLLELGSSLQYDAYKIQADYANLSAAFQECVSGNYESASDSSVTVKK